jgi:hypothetical protein
LSAHKTAQGRARIQPAFLIIFDILTQEMLLTEEAAIAVDSQSEICWKTDWKKKTCF